MVLGWLYLVGNYWSAFLVGLILTITGGGNSSGINFRTSSELGWSSRIVSLFWLVGITFLLFRIFIGYIIEVGSRKYHLQLAEGLSDIGLIGFGFRNNRYGKVISAMFFKALYIFLWSLLLIIPGIIKLYAYRFAPYILAENPFIGTDRALELSNSMTMGEKWNMFVFDLSFIGWYLLGILAFGLGVLFVQPYYDASLTQLYFELKNKAIAAGITNKYELTGDPNIV